MLSKPVGEKNYADLLDEDKGIAGQKYCCLSFVSPEKIIENKHLFYSRMMTLAMFVKRRV